MAYSKGRKPKDKVRKGDNKGRERDDRVEVTVDDKRYSSRTRGARGRSSSDRSKDGRNDPRWYGVNPQLVRDFASFPYGKPVGQGYNTGVPSIDSQAIPGVMRVDFVPAIGYATDENSPVNVAMRQIYSFVRKKNSGAANYQAPDLMKYLISLDSCYTYLAWLRRVYGLMMDYSYVNRYWPEAILQMMGLNVQDLQSNYAQLRGYINLYASKVSSMSIPATMPYMLRHSWMCSELYVDSNQEKAQVYFYNPTHLYRYYEGTGAAQSLLNLTPMPGFATQYDQTSTIVPGTLAGLMSFGDSLINPLIGSGASNNMSGDILKAFEGNIVQAVGVTDDYRVIPYYNEEVLSQIMNATAVGYVYGKAPITEKTGINEGWLQCTPSVHVYRSSVFKDTSVSSTSPTGPNVARVTTWGNSVAEYIAESQFAKAVHGNRYVTFNKGDISADDTMVATRLTNICNISTAAGSWMYTANSTGGDFTAQRLVDIIGEVVTCGSEICERFVIGYFTFNNGVRSLQYSDFSSIVMPRGEVQVGVAGGTAAYNSSAVQAFTIKPMVNAMQSVERTLVRLQAFDWHPGIIVFPHALGNVNSPIDLNSSSDVGVIEPVVAVGDPIGIAQDLGNFTVLTQQDLINLAEVALLSEFYIPEVGVMSIGLA